MLLTIFCSKFPASVKAVLTRLDGSEVTDACEVYLFGAHVMSWTAASVERFWQSSLSVMDGSGPLRGGVPIAWPQFAVQGPLRLHGFARDGIWQVVRAEAGEDAHIIVFERSDDEATRDLWPHPFRLRYTVCLGKNRLQVTLDVENTGDAAFNFTSCFHTYIRVPDVRQVFLEGLKGTTYFDKNDDMKEKVEEDDDLRVEAASAASKGLVDRIYKSSPKALNLMDRGSGVRYAVRQTPSFPDTVIYNPWEEGKKGEKGPDFDDDGFNYTICIEPAVAAEPMVVEAGATWSGGQLIEVFQEELSAGQTS